MPQAHRDSALRHPSPGSAAGGGPYAASTMSLTSSSLALTYRYRDIVEAPRSAATRLIDTAPRPSRAAIVMAAWTMRSRLRPGFGPLPGLSRTPHAAATAAGSAAPCSWSMAHSLRWPVYQAAGARRPGLELTALSLLCIPYAIVRMPYAEAGPAETGAARDGQ